MKSQYLVSYRKLCRSNIKYNSSSFLKDLILTLNGVHVKNCKANTKKNNSHGANVGTSYVYTYL